MMGKKSSEKVRKNFFLYSHEYRAEKIWGKNARNNFSRSIRIMRAKCSEKNRRKKVRKTFFLYSHEYRDQKMGGQNERNNFSRNTRIVRAKNVGKKNV